MARAQVHTLCWRLRVYRRGKSDANHGFTGPRICAAILCKGASIDVVYGPSARMRVIGLAGWSGAGKTTLLRRLIPLLSRRGLETSTLKHAHHSFDIDQPGKDSWEHRQAGAREVLVASSARWALMRELRSDTEPRLPDLLTHMSPVDLVIIEGFKRERHPKIEIHRAANAKPLLYPDDGSIVAIASDEALPGLAIPLHHLDDTEAIADTVQSYAVEIGAVDWGGWCDS